MDKPTTNRTSTQDRSLATLKLVSRLLGHELHSQASAKAITLSREEVEEIQVTLDLFIEQAARGAGSTAGIKAAAAERRVVPASN
ncbi:MAG: hypothetical protein QF903_16095 [Planctomycetota bacterium]|nr:hypothetical protein [Planctomycetota bacterium]MDP6762553.1 hypothetical protein [Planctomycetota bacterium]MDP6990992.1 hypothetical protein [Planctomycetota bacterium]